MARNPITGPRPQPPRTVAPRVVAAALVGGILLFVGIPWLVAPADVEPELAGPASSQPTAAAPEVPAVAPAETPADTVPLAGPRPFLDASGAGATAYAAGDYDGALAQYRAAIERNPDDAESHSNLGQVLVRLKQPAEALPHFDRALQLIPDRWAYHFNRARALGLLQRWEDAVAGYRQAQQLFPNDYATAFNLGQALQRKGDDTGAAEQYLRAIALNDADPSFRLALGATYERLQRKVEAAAAFSEYLRLAPDAPDAEKIRARIAQLTGA